jgi:hypothetical protein
MDFTLDKKHEMARGLFRDFAETEVKPLAQETDETEQFPAETVAKMAKYGFMGIPVPKEYGGQGCDPLTYVTCVEELSKVCATTGVIVSAHTSLCIDPIMTFGTEEQKKKYVVPLAKGEKLGAFGLTEPGAGTDAQGCQTKAVLDGDEWVLNGSKCFITNGKVADVYIVIAITSITEDKRGRKKKNFSAFIVEKGAPGFSFGTKEKKMGIRGSSTYELIFEDCRIPKDALLGQEGRGFPIAMHTLDGIEDALDSICQAIKDAGYEPGKDVKIAMDCAASEFAVQENGEWFYDYRQLKDGKKKDPNGKKLTAAEQIKFLEELITKYPIDSIEDGLDENDWDNWVKLTAAIGDRCQLVGDDLFVTNVKFLEKGIKMGAANSILIKVNQIGSLTETLDAIEMAHRHGYTTVTSHRSGETEDTTIADIAVATNSGQIKTGSMSRTDRMAKYNQLIRIEEQLGNNAAYGYKKLK